MAKTKVKRGSPDPLKKIIDIVKVKTKVDLTHYKMTTIRRRVERQMRLKKISDLSKYALYLRKHPEAIDQLYDDIFIHVTDFFRDETAFEAIKKNIFPQLVKNKKPGQQLRFWVAGCATGEEAYSLAILFQEFLKTKKLDLSLLVFATDISPNCIQIARKGMYPAKAMEKLPKKILSYFEKIDDGTYRVNKDTREICVFSEHNLATDPPLSKIDFIICRNVLIYLAPEVQKKIFKLFHFGLSETGYLWLGPSETIGATSEYFSAVDKKLRVYQKSTEIETAPRAQSGRHFARPATERGFSDHLILQKNKVQNIFEQFEAGQEELMAANEELQAANEELQAANEELDARNSELYELNENLHRSEERFRLMVGAVKDYAIFMLDPQGFVTSWNEGARRFMGYEASEIIGKHFSTFYTKTDKDRKHPEYELQKAIEEGRYEEEGWRIRKDGSLFWSSVVITRLNDGQGRIVGFSKVTRDLTERREAELQLRHSEERFRLMVNAVKDYAIFMLDPDGKVASWNEGARRFKGYEAKEIIGKHFSTFYTKADKDRRHPEYELEITKRDGRYEEEGWRVRKDGSMFWANVTITRVNDEHENLLGFVKVTRDLTEKRKNEEALSAAYANLEKKVQERTQELEGALRSRDEFLSIASHELKTPLTSLKLQLQIALRRIAKENSQLSGEIGKSLNVGIRQVDSLNNLVEDLLNVSRIQMGVLTIEPTRFDLSEFAQEISSRFTEQLKQAGSTLELKMDPSIVGKWDRFRLEQVLVNLIFNALKYAPRSPITVSTRRNGTHAYLEVSDQGPGIPADQVESIFNRFERGNTPQNVGGLGLGLFISKRIVELHHGTIHVESAPGKGARFIVELPLS
ncbi:MAG: CheR family methyltransferase [Bacteriovoracaceae bacterium]